MGRDGRRGKMTKISNLVGVVMVALREVVILLPTTLTTMILKAFININK